MKAYPYSDSPRLPGEEDVPVDPRAILPGATGSIELEVGSGRGWFLVERAEEAPTGGVLGLEVKKKWASVVDARLHQLGVESRARVFAEDARQALPRFVPESLRRVYVHFPDPWWKKRHAKRLVVTPEFVASVHRVLEPAGELFVQTDVEDRAADYERAVLEAGGFTPAGNLELGPSGARVSQSPVSAQSPRERRCIKDGLPFVRLLYRKSEA